jgi:hypothetical protein
VGRVKDVLVEKSSIGRSEDYCLVALDREGEPGSVLRARVTASDGARLFATVCA